MNLQPYHSFEYGGHFCVLNVERMLAGVVGEPTAVALAARRAERGAPISPEIAEELSRLALVADGTAPRHSGARRAGIDPVDERPIDTMALFVTQTCNLRCAYCYGVGGEYGQAGQMSEPTATRAVDWLIEQADGSGPLGIFFFGGEPLLNFPLVVQVVEYAEQRARDRGLQFRFVMATNGTVLDEEKLAFLKEHEVYVRVGFDGPADVQNANRPFRNGRGSFETVVRNVRRLLAVLPPEHVSGRATLHGDVDPRRVTAAAREVGFPVCVVVEAAPAVLRQQGPERPVTEERASSPMVIHAEAEAQGLLEAIKNRDREWLRQLHARRGVPPLLKLLLRRQKKRLPCKAGRTYVAVAASGEVFPCHRFVGLESHRIGRVQGGKPDRTDYHRDTLQTVDRCVDCWARYFCGGGCKYEHLARTGSMFMPSEATCQRVKHTAEMAIYLYCQLNHADVDYLVQEKLVPRRHWLWGL